MLIFAGLGNPGPKHAKQRHNIGFMAADAIASLHGFDAWRSQFRALTAQGRIGGKKVLLVKPQTFMNDSGAAIAGAMRFYKVDTDNLITCHDELDLAAGKLRMKRGGGHAGHNGLRSIDSHLGPHYYRLRLGIGHPGEKSRVLGHVLGDFAKSDQPWLVAMIGGIAQEFPRLVEGDHNGFTSRVAMIIHDATKPPAPPKEASKAADTKASGSPA
ncbi:MAG: aminoacyl-tRNA hydrolase [Alphaproteobacteria bacterium]|nr:aminoacyl-tRNA hydrolase [Alphaproteobacteria bacterium SS10]